MAEGSAGAATPPASYAEFWRRYLAAHRSRASRGLHVFGTTAALALILVALATQDWRPLLAAPIVGYGAAWIGHFLIEGNRPETFGHPLWSFFSDIRMSFLWFTGGLAAEFRRHGIEPN